MIGQLIIDGQAMPIGDIEIYFRYFADEQPPYAWVDIISDSSDDTYGGIAINCLSVGDLATINQLAGITMLLRADDESSDNELTESVFWRSEDDTLEIESLSVNFGTVVQGQIQLNIQAICFSWEPIVNIPVSLMGMAIIR